MPGPAAAPHTAPALDVRWGRSRWLGLLTSLAIGLVFLWHARDLESENLRPRRDALEYAFLAHRLAAGEPPVLAIGDRVYPSRYPIGFPFVLAPAAAAGVPAHRLWAVTAAIALAGIACTYVCALGVASPLNATWAALMLALSPLYLYWGVRVMSDVPAATLAALWTLLLIRGTGFGALGLVAGFACSIRLMAVPLVAVATVAAAGRGRTALVRFGLGTLLGLAPFLLSRWLTGFTATAGYVLWHGHGAAANFEWHALRANFPRYTQTLLGIGHPRFYSFVVLPVIVAGLAGGWRSHRRATFVALSAFVALHVGLALFYFFRAERLLLATLPVLLVFAAAGMEHLRTRTPTWAVLLGALAILLQVGPALHLPRPRSRAGRIGPVLADVARRLPPHATVVSDVTPPLAWLYWICGTARTFMPLSELPRGVGREMAGDLGDTYLFRLHQLSARGLTRMPTTFLESGRLTSGARAALAAQRDAPVVAVLCTGYGRRRLGVTLVRATVVAKLPGVRPCKLLALHGVRAKS